MAVHNSSIETVNANYTVVPKISPTSLLGRIIQVSKNTFMSMLYHIGPTFSATFATITLVTQGVPYLALAVGVMWVAFNVYQGISILKHQDRLPLYKEALNELKKIKDDYANQKFEEKIKESSNFNALAQNYAAFKEKVEGYAQSFSKFSSLGYCDVFKDPIFHTIKDNADFTTQKDFIVGLHVKRINDKLDEAIKRLPQFIQRLERNFYRF